MELQTDTTIPCNGPGLNPELTEQGRLASLVTDTLQRNSIARQNVVYLQSSSYADVHFF